MTPYDDITFVLPLGYLLTYLFIIYTADAQEMFVIFYRALLLLLLLSPLLLPASPNWSAPQRK